MNELNFNSQICTTKEQSQRLLELGLKSETADMVYTNASLPFNKDEFHIICKEYSQLNIEVNYEISPFVFIPAWSLHRLIEMLPQNLHFDNNVDTFYYLTIKPFCLTKVMYRQDSGSWLYGSESSNLFDAIIDIIEKMIIGKYFNKEYLKL